MKTLKKIYLGLCMLCVAALYAQPTYYVREWDKVKLFQHPSLETAAQAASLICPAGSTPLKIHSYDLYPVLGATSGDYGLDDEKAAAIADLEAKPYYLGIIKEYISGDPKSIENSAWSVRFTVKLKLPDVAGYEQVDGLEREALRNRVTTAITNEYKDLGLMLNESVARAEVAGMEEFKKTLGYLISGGEFNDEELMAEIGYSKLVFEDYDIRVVKENGFGNKSASRNSSNGKSVEFSLKNQNNWQKLDNLIIKNIVVNNINLTVSSLTENRFEVSFTANAEEIIKKTNSNIVLHIVEICSHCTEGSSDLYWKMIFNIPKLNKELIVQNEFNNNLNKIGMSFKKDGAAIRGDLTGSRSLENWENWGKNQLGSLDGNKIEDRFKALGCGFVDGFLATLITVYNLSFYNPENNFAKNVNDMNTKIVKYAKRACLSDEKEISGNITGVKLSEALREFKNFVDEVKNFIENIKINQLFLDMKISVESFLEGLSEGNIDTFYKAGQLLFEMFMEVISIAAAVVSGGVVIANSAKSLLTAIKTFLKNFNFKNFIKESVTYAKDKYVKTKRTICKLLFDGCFVKDTPILMASNTIGQSGKVYAMAAMMPFVGVPVDDTPLLGYAVAHKSVNASYGMTASGLMNGDPYTSAEQKQRDLYDINDTDWNSVSFEGVYSSSVCHLALHQDWITQHGYVVDGIVNMNLPEQGISGPFKITSIKHILPQKKPQSDPGDVYPVDAINGGYEWKPVTGLFIHHSDQVHNISFDNNEVLGVTAPHPIFSTTHNDWRLAGELEVGEKVLTYHGEATVTKTEKKGGSEAVYNLEVKDLHNFLVGDNSIVVHNACVAGGPCDWLWDVTHNYGSTGWETALQHIWNGHSFSLGKPKGTKSYFSSLFDKDSKIKDLVTEMTQDWGKFKKGEGTLFDFKEYANGDVRFVVDYSSKPHLLDANGFIGYDKNGNGLTKVRVTLNKDFKIYNAFPANTLE